MVPRDYDASSHPRRIRYLHQNIFVFISFAANVVAVVTPKVGWAFDSEQLRRRGVQGQIYHN
jgi:hypothetical protein